MSTFRINIGAWKEYRAESNLELPNSLRQPSAWVYTQGGTATRAIIATTSSLVLSGYVLQINSSLTATNDRLYFNTATTGTSYFMQNVSNARGYTIEAQLQVIDGGNDASHIIRFEDDIYQDDLRLRKTWVGFAGSAATYAFTTTDAYHKYRLAVKGTVCKLYIDDTLRLTATLATTTSNAKYLMFGDTSNAANSGANIYWAYIRYRLDGAMPPEEGNNGWTFAKFEVTDKRRSSLYNVVRSDNSIVPENKMDVTKVKISGTIAGSDWDSFRIAANRLKNILNFGTQKIYIDDTKYIEGLHNGFTLSPITQDFANYSASFDCRYPFWNKTWRSYLSTAPVASATFYITNNGDLETPLKIIITGAAASTGTEFYILNTTSGQKGKFVATLAATQELTVDKGVDEYNTYKVEVNNADSFGSWEGDLFSLLPGVNAFVYGSAIGGNVGTLEFYWRENYLI